VDRPEPSGSQEVRHTARVLAIRFDDHRRQCGPDLARFHEDHADTEIR
jgi:hypothetical protein